MKRKLERFTAFLFAALTALCVVRFVVLLFDYRGVLDLFFAYFGWEAWMEFAVGIIAILIWVLIAVMASMKDEVPAKVEGVHDGA